MERDGWSEWWMDELPGEVPGNIQFQWIDLNGCVAGCETGYRYSTVYTGVTGPVTTVACTTLGAVMASGVSCRHFYL